jgi:hypothetical protein
MEPGDNFNSLIYDIHLKPTLRRDRGSFAIDKIMRLINKNADLLVCNSMRLYRHKVKRRSAKTVRAL